MRNRREACGEADASQLPHNLMVAEASAIGHEICSAARPCVLVFPWLVQALNEGLVSAVPQVQCKALNLGASKLADVSSESHIKRGPAYNLRAAR